MENQKTIEALNKLIQINNDRFEGYDAAFNVTSLTYMNTIAPVPIGFISYIDVQGAGDSEMVITFSNYGLSSVFRSTNANLVGNATWTALDVPGIAGSLPDVPVWSAVFAPANTIRGGTGIKLLIGTEIGVYTTNTYNGTWELDNNSPRTRVTQIKYRPTDKMLLMSTYGRGLWRSDMFCTNQIWFGSKIAQADVNCGPVVVTYRDSSINVTSRAWEIIQGNNPPLLIGTGVEVTRTAATNNLSNISEWDWISLRVTFTDGTIITQKRRVGEMVKIFGCAGCCRILALEDKSEDENGFSLYPNPNYTKHLTIEFTKNATDNRHLRIYNIQGQTVFTQQITENKQEIELDNNIINGMYIVEVTSGQQRFRKKLVVIGQ